MKKLVYIAIALFMLVVFANSCSDSKEKGEQRADGQTESPTTQDTQDAQATNTATAAAEPASASNWDYQQEEDKMRGTKVHFAHTLSTNAADFSFPYGKSQAAINLRHNQSGTDAMLRIVSGQFDCNYDGCSIAVKFDDGAIETYRMSNADNGLNDVLFFDNPKAFIKKLKSSKSVIIEAPFFNHGKEQFEFNIAGLDWQH
ncbi:MULTISPECIES: hypothetical protein [unclassified Moraxella]|uniref:hypothetical protein n=1 Tax=unclassified Moraxella TaxID=2685852 RepID=UPI00359DDF7E